MYDQGAGKLHFSTFLLVLFGLLLTEASASKGKVVELTETNFEKLVLNSNDLWLVEFFAPWCGHCKKLEPSWKAAAAELEGKVNLGAVDTTVHTDLANKFGIHGFLTIKYFAPGSEATDAIDYGMLAYDWDQGKVLSARGDEYSCLVKERTPHILLRPIFINAVEVGYAYTQCDKDRRLNVRGVTIALWYFISRGHQAVALLPYCFKTYSDKSSSWSELMFLFKMNLVEFTPGFGSDKYIEVNRILATRADEVGGCIVARSQMHGIVEERPHLSKTVERRLLMPSFNGHDIIFPVDGPLGRGGPSLIATMECPLTEEDWGYCSHHQMTFKDQKIWVQKLACLVPEQLSWISLYREMERFEPKTPLPKIAFPQRPVQLTHSKIHPPETNPIDGKGYSYTRAALRRNCSSDTYIFGVTSYGPSVTYRDQLGFERHFHDDYYDHSERMDPFLPEYARTGLESVKIEPRFADETPPVNFLGEEGSIYRIRSKTEPDKTDQQLPTKEQEEVVNKLTAIFGIQKAIRIAGKNPKLSNISLLVEFGLNDSEGDETSCQERTTDSCSSSIDSMEMINFPTSTRQPSTRQSSLMD